MRIFKIVLLFFTIVTNAQVQWTENFNDLNTSYSTNWFGDTNSFFVNSHHQLQLNASPNHSLQSIAKKSNLIQNTQWEFYTKILFNPSSSNYQKVYLWANDSVVNSATKSVYLEIGRTSDNIRLLEFNNGTTSVLTETSNSPLNNTENEIWWKINNTNSNWFVSYSLDSISWNNLPTVYKEIHSENHLFAWEIKYTSTRKDKSFIDNIKVIGFPFKDTIQPTVTNFKLEAEKQLKIYFSEPIKLNTLQNNNFSLDGILPSINAIHTDSISLLFNDALLNKKYNLEIKNLEDLKGNSLDTILEIKWEYTSVFDVLITEVYMNPSTDLNFLTQEAIELYNPKSYAINLKDFYLMIGSKKHVIPEFKLQANSYCSIFSDKAKGTINSSLNPLFLESDFTLPNTKSILKLISNKNTILYQLDYNTDWIKDTYKKKGGWSLERTTIDLPCVADWVWQVSENENGHTLGSENSTNLNTIETNNFTIEKTTFKENILQVKFPFIVTDSSFLRVNSYTSTLKIVSINKLNWNTLEFRFKTHGEKNKMYFINFLPAFNCIEIPEINFVFTDYPKENEFVINEVCFDVDEHYTEFIEVYNTTDNYYQTKDILLQVEASSLNTISDRNRFIKPNSFIVLSKNKEAIFKNYPPQENALYLNNSHFPTLNNTEESITIKTKSLQVINTACYNTNWHHYSIENTKNRSLEKRDYLLEPCNKNSWYSATKHVGFATPGEENSQYKNNNLLTENYFMDSFHPELDGNKDTWIYRTTFNETENLISAFIYDLNGVKRFTFSENELYAQSLEFIWDGKDDNLILLPKGTYIFLLYNLTENTKIKKAITIL